MRTPRKSHASSSPDPYFSIEMGKAKTFTPAVGFLKEGGKTRPITARKQTKLRLIRRVKTPVKGYPYSQPRRVMPMLTDRGSEEDLDRPGYVAQRKYDGNRTIIIKDGDSVVLRSRSWKSDFADDYPRLVKAVWRIPEKRLVADADLTFFRKGTDEDEMLTALASPETKRGYDVRLLVFDPAVFFILWLGFQTWLALRVFGVRKSLDGF